MATSGTINGTRSGINPYLRINWSRIETDVGGNRSKLRLQLYLIHPNPVYYSATKRGVLQGSSFSSTTNVSGTGSTLLRTRDIWVGHNADGSKTQRLSASFNINITFSGSRIGKLTVSGNAAINSIPRGSTLSAFSFESSLQIGTSNTINYTVKRHSGNFRHQIQLRDGSVTIATWDNVSSNGSSSLSLTGTQVNTLLGRMSTVTSKSFTLRVSTRSGVNGGWIGSAVTRKASVSVNSNVKPSISSTSAKPIGNSWAVGKGFYVQGQTGVQAEFSSNARGGAGVRSRNISIGSLSSGGSTVGGVFRHSHTRLNTTGNVTITYKITDTRGRTASSKRTINVRAYTSPQVTDFSSDRASTTSSTVRVKSKGSIHGMGGQNTGTMRITQKGVSGNVRSISLNNTTPTFNDSFNRTVSTASSAEFTITVTDSLGNSATAFTSVGTAFMELSIRKGTGVGIGKVHERGDLDIAGNMYLDGFFSIGNADSPTSEIRMVSSTPEYGNAGVELTSNQPDGVTYIDFNTTRNSSDSGMGDSRIRSEGGTASEHLKGFLELQSGTIEFSSDELRWNGDHIMNSGHNSNGHWVRYHDGTMIQRSNMMDFTSSTLPRGTKNGAGFFQSDRIVFRFPTSFYLNPTITFAHSLNGNPIWHSVSHNYTTSASMFLYSTQARSGSGKFWFTAIGRWRD